MVARGVDPYRIAVLDLGIAQQKEKVRWLKRMIKASSGAADGGRHDASERRRAIDMWAPIVPVPEVMRARRRALPEGDGRATCGSSTSGSREPAEFGKPRPAMRDERGGGDRGARRGRHRADADHRLRRVVERARDVHPERARRRARRAPSGPLHPVRRRRRAEGHGRACASSSTWCATAASAA